MTRDNDLCVSCKCGQVSITKLDGYLNSDLLDAAHLGMLAEEGCRKKRLRKWLFGLGTVVLAAILVAGTGWWSGERDRQRTEEAVRLSRIGERARDAGNYEAAIAAFTDSVKMKPEARTYLFLAFCKYQEEDYDGARKDLMEAKVLYPSNKDITYALDTLDYVSKRQSQHR